MRKNFIQQLNLSLRGRFQKHFHTTNTKRYLVSTFWLTLSKFLGMGISLASTLYITRALGPQNFGELSYAQSIIGILGFLNALTSSQILYRDLIKSPEKEKVLLGTAWSLSFVVSILTTSIILLYTFIKPHDTLTTQVISILALAQLFASFLMVQNTFYAKTETKLISIFQFSLHFSVSLAKIIAMVMGHGVLILASIMFLEQLVAAVVYLLLYYRSSKISPFTWRFDKSYAKTLLLDSLPMVIVTSSAAISARIDQVMIREYLDITTVGLYHAAVQLTEIWQYIPGLILAGIFPAIVNAKTASRGTYHKRLVALGFVFFIYGSLASLFTIYLAPKLISFIYSDAFLASVPYLKIYAWSITGTILGFLVSTFLITENHRKLQIAMGVIPMLLNVILNYLWIPKYGAEGAAWATVISYTVTPLLPLVVLRFRRE